jgi:hypothetical protein
VSILRPLSSTLFLAALFGSCARSAAPAGNDGGNDGGLDPSAYVKGTRIAPILLQGDGAEILGGWQDNQLGVRCSWIAQPDGSLRCYPDSIGLGLVYLDAACSRPAVVLSTASLLGSCGRLAFFHSPAPGQCGEGTFRRLGPPSDLAPATARYRLTDGACALALPSNPGDHLLELGESLPPGSLAVGHLRPVAGPGRLQAMVIESDDGARGAYRYYYDQTMARRCAAARSADGHRRCLPFSDHVAESSFFSDATCTELAANEPAGCPKESFVWSTIWDGCLSRARVRELGAAIPAQYASGANGTCGPMIGGLDPDVAAYAQGPEVPPASLLEVNQMVEPGPQRLRRYLDQTPTGAWPIAGLFDQQLQLACSPGIAGDGLLRCLPPSVLAAPSYADAACTVPLVEQAEHQCAPTYAHRESSGSCPTGNRLFKVGLSYAGPSYLLVSGTCQASSATRHFFQLADEVPPETFAELKETRR